MHGRVWQCYIYYFKKTLRNKVIKGGYITVYTRVTIIYLSY